MNLESKRKVKQAVRHIELGEFNLAEKIANEFTSPTINFEDAFDQGTLEWVSGKLVEEKRDWTQAAKHFELSVKMFADSPYLEELIRSKDALGYAYLQLGRNEEALDIFFQTYQLANQHFIGGVQRVSLILHSSIAHARLGEYHSAIRLLGMAREHNAASGTLYKEGQILMELGICQMKLNRLELAGDCYQKALIYFKMMSDRENIAGTLMNLGILNRTLGQLNQSAENLLTSKAIYEELALCSQQTTLELVKTYMAKKEWQRSALMCQEVTNKPSCKSLAALAYKLLGMIEHHKGHYEQALQHYAFSLQINQQLTSDSEGADLYKRMAETYFAQRNFEQAAHYYQLSTQ